MRTAEWYINLNFLFLHTIEITRCVNYKSFIFSGVNWGAITQHFFKSHSPFKKIFLHSVVGVIKFRERNIFYLIFGQLNFILFSHAYRSLLNEVAEPRRQDRVWRDWKNSTDRYDIVWTPWVAERRVDLTKIPLKAGSLYTCLLLKAKSHHFAQTLVTHAFERAIFLEHPDPGRRGICFSRIPYTQATTIRKSHKLSAYEPTEDLDQLQRARSSPEVAMPGSSENCRNYSSSSLSSDDASVKIERQMGEESSSDGAKELRNREAPGSGSADNGGTESSGVPNFVLFLFIWFSFLVLCRLVDRER